MMKSCSGYFVLALTAAMILGRGPLYSQHTRDTSYTLPAVDVYGNRLRISSSGIKIEKVDSLSLSLLQHKRLSDLIERNTLLYSKNFGAGNLSTLSFRGTSSSQSGVYWNGFELNPPGAGMMDISLIPVLLFNKVEINYGGAYGIYGSSNIGGGLHLDNETLLGTGNTLTAGIAAGSFGESQQYAAMEINKTSWGSKSAIFHFHTRNNYPYETEGQSLERDHADIVQYGLMQTFEKLWRGHHFKMGLWTQQSQRELPASTTSANMNADREDQSVRFTGRWKKSRGKGLWSAGIAFLNDYLHYTEAPLDTLLLLDSKITNSSWVADAAYRVEFSRLKTILTASITGSYKEIDIHEYGGRVSQSQEYLTLLFIQPFAKEKGQLSLSARQESVSGFNPPLGFSGGMDWKFSANLSARLNASKNYRVPSMNDRYWKPGGNDKLKAESGINVNGGLMWSGAIKTMSFAMSGDLFYSDIHDWIAWVPTVYGYFAATNVQRVEIKGIETSGQIEIKIATMLLKINASWSTTEAINKRKLNVYDQSEGKQLIYTPRYRFNGAVNIKWKKALLSYHHSFTGNCFTDRENTEMVDAFTRGDIQFRYFWKLKHRWAVEAHFDVENILDSRYEIVKYYPMPGRLFRIGLSAKINFSN